MPFKMFIKVDMRTLLFLCLILCQPLRVFCEEDPTWNVETRWIDVKEGSLFCKIAGEGDPIVILHGGPVAIHDNISSAFWGLSKTNKVIFYYQRGSGTSKGKLSKEMLVWGTFVEDLERLREVLGLETMTLLGYSWGTNLGMKYAMAYPERVQRLILMSPLPISTDDCFTTLKRESAAVAPYKKEIQAIESSQGFAEDDPEIAALYSEVSSRPFFYDPEQSKLLDHRVSIAQLVHAKKMRDIFVYNELFSQITAVSWAKFLNKFSFPTLILQGDSDTVPVSVGKKIQKSIRGSEYVQFEHCGHFPYLEKPEEVLDCIADFLDRTSD